MYLIASYLLILMVLKHNGVTIASQIDIARSIFSKLAGLMFRKNISQDYAMIFLFKKPAIVGVHMMFMRFPIDVIFLDQDKKIIGISTLKPWWTHKQMKKVMYLIEMKQGAAEKYGLKTGDILDFEG